MRNKSFWMLIVSIYTFLFIPLLPVWVLAEETISGPLIQHETPAQTAPSGKPLVIQATITDKAGIKEAILYYRKAGEESYQHLNMMPSENDLYSATIPAGEVKSPGLEYYIQAADK